MGRLLFLAAIVIVVYLLIKSFRGRMVKSAPPAGVEDMVRCAHCGVHLPKSESFLADGKYYCSDAHRLAHQAPPRNPNVG